MTEPTNQGDGVLASTRPTRRQRIGLGLSGIALLVVASAMVGVWTQSHDLSAPPTFFLAAGVVTLAYVTVRVLRAASGREPWLEVTADELRMVTVNGLEKRLAIAQVQQVEAQPRPKVIWEDADGRTRLTDLDHRRAAVRVTGVGGETFGAVAGPGFEDVVAQAREWVAQRPDLVADPVSAQMLGETDADEALDCDEGPDEDDV
ncbi:hypothetical protein [Phycicoccus elongatus]|jgi:hypothetical protein|uniref:hypothetical protein n=1 Tax=Phycicoccus elongatus TaxID=101689 RepID=UPI003784E29B